MENLYTEKRHGLNIEIYQDDNGGDSPADWGDDSLFVVGNSSRHFWVKAPAEALALPASDFHIFTLEAYIHGGVVLALAGCGSFPDRQWDVCNGIGAVYAKRTDFKTRKAARIAAAGLVATWNQYLSGEIYGYQIKSASGQDVESCWGFYGDYDKDGGALLEARAMVDALTHTGTTDHTGQRLFPWMLETAGA